MLRRTIDWFTDRFFGAWAYSVTPEKIPDVRSPILLWDIETLTSKIRSREVTCQTVVETYIDRIEEVNGILNCVVERNYESARKNAAFLDDLLLKENENIELLPLIGVPFTVKCSYDVEGLPISVGVISLRNRICDQNAQVVQCLIDKGAILLAVTNVSELCMWYECYNPVYGRTNNPHDTRRTCGGSTGGEGALVASAGTAFGIGSDIGGSLRMPACFNGVFTHKSSPGLISNEGQFPVVKNQLLQYLATGPICRYAPDLSFLCKILFQDQMPNNTLPYSLPEPLDLKKKVTFYFMRDDGGNQGVSRPDPFVRASFERLLNTLGACGARVEEVHFREMKFSADMWEALYFGADSPPFAQDLGRTGHPIIPYWEFLKWICFASEHSLPAVLLCIAEKRHDRSNYKKYQTMCELLFSKFQDVLGEHNVFLYPTHPRIAPYHRQALFMPHNFAYTGIFNVLGLPVTQCPIHREGEVPTGVQIVASRNNDHLTLAVARYFEGIVSSWIHPF